MASYTNLHIDDVIAHSFLSEVVSVADRDGIIITSPLQGENIFDMKMFFKKENIQKGRRRSSKLFEYLQANWIRIRSSRDLDMSMKWDIKL